MSLRRPWQAWLLVALLAAATIGLVVEFIDYYPYISAFPAPDLFAIVCGGAAVVALALGSRVAYPLTLLFIAALLAGGRYPLDTLLFGAPVCALLICRPCRRHCGMAKARWQEPEPGEVSLYKAPPRPMRPAGVAAVTLAVAVLAVALALAGTNLSRFFYIENSREDQERILHYIDTTYGKNVTETDSGDYKRYGSVYVTLRDGRRDGVSAFDGRIEDRLLLSFLEKRYQQQFGELSPDYNIYVYLYLGWERPNGFDAYLSIYPTPYAHSADPPSTQELTAQANLLYEPVCTLLDDRYEVVFLHFSDTGIYWEPSRLAGLFPQPSRPGSDRSDDWELRISRPHSRQEFVERYVRFLSGGQDAAP